MSDETTTSDEGVVGVGMIVAAYNDEDAAKEVFGAMKQAKKSGDFYFEDAAVIHQDKKGKVHIKETGDMSTGKGAGIGAVIGGLIGILGGPAGIALGAGAGAAIGGVAAHGDAGYSDKSLKTIGGGLLPGTSAVIAITSGEFLHAVRKEVPESETLAFSRELASDIHDSLQAGQDVVYGLAITENALGMTRIAADDESASVFFVAADADTAVVGAAVATDEDAEGVVVVATDEEAPDAPADDSGDSDAATDDGGEEASS